MEAKGRGPPIASTELERSRSAEIRLFETLKSLNPARAECNQYKGRTVVQSIITPTSNEHMSLAVIPMVAAMRRSPSSCQNQEWLQKAHESFQLTASNYSGLGTSGRHSSNSNRRGPVCRRWMTSVQQDRKAPRVYVELSEAPKSFGVKGFLLSNRFALISTPTRTGVRIRAFFLERKARVFISEFH
jgi:hypothetical protein